MHHIINEWRSIYTSTCYKIIKKNKVAVLIANLHCSLFHFWAQDQLNMCFFVAKGIFIWELWAELKSHYESCFALYPFCGVLHFIQCFPWFLAKFITGSLCQLLARHAASQPSITVWQACDVSTVMLYACCDVWMEIHASFESRFWQKLLCVDSWQKLWIVLLNWQMSSVIQSFQVCRQCRKGQTKTVLLQNIITFLHNCFHFIQ